MPIEEVAYELQRKAVPTGKKKRLSDDSQLRIFVIVLLALAVIAGLIFGG